MCTSLNNLAQLPSLLQPRTAVGFRKPIKLCQQQRNLPLIEGGVPIRIQGPQHREVHRVQRRKEVRPLRSDLGTSDGLSRISAYLHIDDAMTVPAAGVCIGFSSGGNLQSRVSVSTPADNCEQSRTPASDRSSSGAYHVKVERTSELFWDEEVVR